MEQQVFLYAADVTCLQNKALFEKAYRSVGSQRQKKVDAKKFQKDKLLSLGAGVLLKKALTENGIRYERAVFAEEPNGRPYIAGNSVYFNLSHSGTKVLCAVSPVPVGCDVEQIDHFDDTIVKRFFHEKEASAIFSSQSEEQKRERFYRIWTLKESFLKATGQGFSLPLNQFCITLWDPIVIEQEYSEEEFHFKEFDLGDGYRYACCSVCENIGDLKIVRL